MCTVPHIVSVLLLYYTVSRKMARFNLLLLRYLSISFDTFLTCLNNVTSDYTYMSTKNIFAQGSWVVFSGYCYCRWLWKKTSARNYAHLLHTCSQYPYDWCTLLSKSSLHWTSCLQTRSAFALTYFQCHKMIAKLNKQKQSDVEIFMCN